MPWFLKDEWVISRVFQKSNTTGNGGGGSTVSATTSGGSKKTRMTTTTNTTNSASNSVSLCPEPSSPSSVYLPPLLDHSPYNPNNNTFNDRQSCSYNNHHHQREHVSCFSTTTSSAVNVSTNNNNSFPINASFDLSPTNMDPFARFQRNVGVSAFPSLRSLQDNLQLPLFFSSAAQPFHGGGAGDILGSWPVAPEEQRGGVAGDVGGSNNMALGSSELDCMWGY